VDVRGGGRAVNFDLRDDTTRDTNNTNTSDTLPPSTSAALEGTATYRHPPSSFFFVVFAGRCQCFAAKTMLRLSSLEAANRVVGVVPYSYYDEVLFLTAGTVRTAASGFNRRCHDDSVVGSCGNVSSAPDSVAAIGTGTPPMTVGPGGGWCWCQSEVLTRDDASAKGFYRASETWVWTSSRYTSLLILVLGVVQTKEPQSSHLVVPHMMTIILRKTTSDEYGRDDYDDDNYNVDCATEEWPASSFLFTSGKKSSSSSSRHWWWW
jgi:hypothetical protein